jgi:hypothetical protein
VKLCEPELSLVCYHYRRGWGRRSVSLFHSLPENSAKAECFDGQHSQTEDSLQRIIINPFYTITVAPQLTEEYEPAMSDAEWVQANSSLTEEMGSAQWLRRLLDVLEGKADAPEGPINPSQAVNIDPLFAVAHAPLIERELWIDVNTKHIRNMGSEG